MAVTIDGTNGVTTPAESVTGTGVWSVGGSQIYKDASGNVGIGTGSVTSGVKLQVQSTGGTILQIKDITSGSGDYSNIWFGDEAADFAGFLGYNHSTDAMTFGTGGAERARIDASGNLLVGTTSLGGAGGVTFQVAASGGATQQIFNRVDVGATNSGAMIFRNGGAQVGYIQYNNTGTTFGTGSDYRLKNTIAPMIGALDKVALLKPVTYKWNVDGSDGQGFIAHELAEVEPSCVTGEKDAVDAEGKPQYQGIDTSFLVATLTAAIQELKAIIDTQATRITALEGAAA